MLGPGTRIVTEALANEWVRHFRRSPLVTSLATITAVAILVVIGFQVDSFQKEKRQNARLESANYREQVDRLTEMQANVTQLLSFLENQKKTLDETQDTIAALESQRAKLKPLVETDQKVVESIFRIQEERVNGSIWRERWVGFGFGVAASLLASFLWYVLLKLSQKKPTGDETTSDKQ